MANGDNRLKIGVEVQPEAFITPQDIKNFQKTIALALKDLRVPPSTIKQVTGLGDSVVKKVLGDTGEFKRGIKAYSEALEKLSNLPFERGRGRQEAERDFQARQKQARDQRQKEIKEIEKIFASEAKTFGRGQVKLIEEASKRTNTALRQNLLKLSDSYKQSLRIVNREIERSAEFKKGLDLIQATGLDDKALSQLKKKELDAIRVVREVSQRVSKEIRAVRDNIAATSKTTGVDAPETLLTSLGLSAQQIKEFETRAAKAINAQDRVARQIQQRRARLRETEPFLRPLEAPIGAAAAARAPVGAGRAQPGVAGPDLDAILDRAFARASGGVPGRGVDIDELRLQMPELSRAQQDALITRAGDQGRAALYPQEDPRALRRETARAAIRLGGDDIHRVYLDAASSAIREAAQGAPRAAAEAPERGAATRDDRFRRDFISAFNELKREMGENEVALDTLQKRLAQFSPKEFSAGVQRLRQRGEIGVAGTGPGARVQVSLADTATDLRKLGTEIGKGTQLDATQLERTLQAGVPPVRPPGPPPAVAAAAPAPAPRPGGLPGTGGEPLVDLQKRIAGLKKREATLREILNLEELTDKERAEFNKQLLQTTKLLEKITAQEKALSQQQRQSEAAARKAQQEEIKRAQQRVALLKRVQQARSLLSKDVTLFSSEDQRTAVLLRDELGKTAQEIQKGRNELQLSAKQSEELGRIWAGLKIKQREISEEQKKRAQLERKREADARKETARIERQKKLLEEVNREAKRFEELKGADIKLLDPARLKLQKKEIQDYATSLNKLEKELLKDAKAAKRLGIDLAEVRQRKVDAARATEQLTQRVNRMGGAFSNASQVLRQFIRYAVGYGGLYRLIGIFNQLGRSIVDLQQDLKSIQAVTNSTEQDMIGIARAITDVALSTRFSVRDIASAAQLLGQAGVEASEIQGVLQSTANFASAVGGSLETAADLVSTFRNVFSELSSKAIADQLTTAVNISKLASEDLKTILSLSAQTARGYQLTSEQYLAAVTTLRNAGIKASTVATGLRQALIEIFSPDNRTIQILQKRYAELGEVLSGEDIRARFFEIQQSNNPLTAALRELERLGISGGAERQFGRIFDIRALNVIKALIQDIGKLETDAAELSFGGSAAKASATQMEALNAQVTNLGAAFTTFGFQILEGPVEALTEFVELTVDAINAAARLDLALKAGGQEGLGEKLASGLAAGIGVGAFARGGIAKRVAAGAAAGGGVAVAEIGAAGDSTGTFLAGLAAAFGGIALASEKSTKEVDTMNKLREKGASRATIALKGLRFAVTRFFTGWIGWALLAWEAFDAISDYMDSQTTSFEKIETSAIAAVRASRAATAEFERQFQDYENIRLTTANQESAAGTAARAIEDLQQRFVVQSQDLANFVQGLGGTTQQQTEEIRAILQQFSGRARAGEAGTRAREALRQQIADVLDIRADRLQQLDFQLNALLAEEGDINRFSAQYIESFNRAINDARAAGEEATATQQALLESYEQLEPEEIVELTSLAGEAREGTVDLIEQVLQRANALIEREMGRRQDEDLGSKFDQELRATAAYLAELQQAGRTTDFQRTLNAFVEANAGLFGTWQEVYDDLILQLNETSAEVVQQAEKSLLERGLELAAGISPFAFAAPSVIQAREAGRTQQTAAGQRRQAGSTEAERLVRESQESYARGIEKENQSRLDELRAHYDDMQSLQDSERGIYKSAVDLLSPQFKERFDAFQEQGAEGDFGGFLQADEGGRQRINAELQKAFEAWTDSVIKARTQFEADQKRIRQERLAAINTQKFLVNQELKDAKARGEDFSKIEALVKQRTALQTEENNLKIKALEDTAQFDTQSKKLRADNLRLLQERDIALRDELRVSQQRVARLKEQEAQFKAATDQDQALVAAFEGDRQQAFDLATQSLLARREALEAQREAAELIQDQKEKELKIAELADDEVELYQTALELRADIVDTLNRELSFQAQTGTTRQGALELTRFTAAGGRQTREQQGQRNEIRLEALAKQDQLLAERVRLQEEIIANEDENAAAQERLYALELQRYNVQKEMMQLEGEQQQLREGIFGNLAQALDPEQLRSRLEEMNSGLNNVANTIQNKLVTGIDGLASGLATAITTGKSLGDTLRQTFQQTAQSITQAILKALILKAVLAATGGSGGFLSGLFGGGGGGGGTQGAATGAVVSDTGSLEKSSGGGGIIRGPSGLDNILGALRSKAGQFIEPIGVEAGEAILNGKARSLLGDDFIHKLNAGNLRGFADGGVVRPRDVLPPRTSNETNVTVDNGAPRIVNVLDPGVVGDFLDSPEGDRIIVNKIERNQAAISTVT